MANNSPQASQAPKGEGRRLRRARNALKRFAGATEAKLKRRFERAQAVLVADALRKS